MKLPDGLILLRSTPIFNQDNLPAALRTDHSTKEGSWGRIRLLSGRLRYEVTDKRRPHLALLLTPDCAPAVIEPTILHRVEPVGPVEFLVEFYRAP